MSNRRGSPRSWECRRGRTGKRVERPNLRLRHRLGELPEVRVPLAACQGWEPLEEGRRQPHLGWSKIMSSVMIAETDCGDIAAGERSMDIMLPASWEEGAKLTGSREVPAGWDGERRREKTR